MSKRLSAEIEIEAAAERIWEILTDFAAYPDWNPFIRRIVGVPETGARLAVRIDPPGGRNAMPRPTVVAVEPNRELRWLGRLGLIGLFDGEHGFRLKPLGETRALLVQEERFSGLLVPLLGGALGATERGFDEMNRALKARAEMTPTV